MMERMNKTLGSLLLICALGLSTAHADTLDDSIHSAADALGGLVQESGQFTYQVSLDGKPPERDYNVLHHAGAIYYLGLYLRQFPGAIGSESIRQAIVRASRFLVEKSIHPVPERGRALMAVFSLPALSKSNDNDAMLGSSSLGVLALLASEEAQPGSVNSKLIRQVGDFLLFLQKKDGDFYDGYVPEQGGRQDKWHSVLYPGEAILALTALYRWDHNRKWLNAARRGLIYRAKSGDGKSGGALLDNWSMKAAAELWKIPGALSPADQSLLIPYTVRVCQADLNWQTQLQTSVAAGRLEGLAAALSYIPNTLPGLRRMLRAKADEDVAFLLKAQVPSGKYKGMIPETPGGVFVQIDIIWHALNGLMEYRAIAAP